jgi:hypothetical protein
MTYNRLLQCMALCTLIIQACTKNADYITTISASENPYLLQVDTFSAEAIVYRPDSFQTSDKSVLFAGKIKDPVFGEITCSPYFRIGLPSNETELSPESSNASYFDSLVLILRPNKAYYGDTNAIFRLGVYRLSDNLSNENNVFFNNHAFSTYDNLLGRYNSVWHPNGEDTAIRIKLDETLGRELFNLFKANSSTVTDAAVFNDYFRGLKLAPDQQTNAIYGLIADSTVLRLHYHNDVGVNEDKILDLPVVTEIYSYYSVDVNRSGTELAELDSKTEIPSKGYIYNNELTGVKTRISFPYLKDLQKNGDFVKVMAAQFSLRPNLERYTGYFSLPPSIHLYTYNTSGVLSGPISSSSSATSQTGNLIKDDNFGTNTRYTYDVTEFVKNELSATSFTTLSLVPTVTDNENSVFQLVGGMPGNAKYNSNLAVFMLVYDKKR